MKKTKKVLLTVLSVLTVAAVSLGAASCDLLESALSSILGPTSNSSTGDSSTENSSMEDSSSEDSSSENSSMENSSMENSSSEDNSTEDSSSEHMEHTWTENYQYDDSYHWIECTVCPEIKDKAEHTPDETGECSVCKALISVPQGVRYRVSSQGTYAEVIGYNGAETEIKIADTYNGLPVKTIYEKAFYDHDKITSVEIPDGVTSIGLSAFEGCDNLASVEIPDSVTSIGSYTFAYCGSLTSVEIPDGVPSIGNYAFAYCDSLMSVKIPDSVTSIGRGAFYNCSNLTSVYITDIEAWCNILFVNVEANPLYCGANLYLNNELITELTIPDSVTEIKDYAFSSYDSLTSVEIPDGVTSIGAYAFSNCDSLTSVVIGDGVTSIDAWAFSACTELTSVVLGDNVTSIGVEAFDGCIGLTSVYYKGTVSKWSAISIDPSYDGNSYLTNATRYYYRETVPTSSGNYWHYVDGEITTW